MLTHVLILVAGLIVLGISAHYLVQAAIKIALRLKVSEAFIGLTIVTAGIIGVSAVIAPLTVEAGNTLFGFPDNIISMFLLTATILLVLFFMRTGWVLRSGRCHPADDLSCANGV